MRRAVGVEHDRDYCVHALPCRSVRRIPENGCRRAGLKYRAPARRGPGERAGELLSAPCCDHLLAVAIDEDAGNRNRAAWNAQAPRWRRRRYAQDCPGTVGLASSVPTGPANRDLPPRLATATDELAAQPPMAAIISSAWTLVPGSGKRSTRNRKSSTAMPAQLRIRRARAIAGAIELNAGIAVEDFLFRVDRFPDPGHQGPGRRMIAAIGGCAANSSVAVANLGGRSRFAGPVGTDEASQRFLTILRVSASTPAVLARSRRLDFGFRHLHRSQRREDGRNTARREARRRAPPGPDALVRDISILLVDNRFSGIRRTDLQGSA